MMSERKFNLGDLVVTKDGISEVANGRKSIGQVLQRITSIVEQAREDGQVVYSYSSERMANHHESMLTAAKDAKKVVMTILAVRMQDVAVMEVPKQPNQHQ